MKKQGGERERERQAQSGREREREREGEGEGEGEGESDYGRLVSLSHSVPLAVVHQIDLDIPRTFPPRGGRRGTERGREREKEGERGRERERERERQEEGEEEEEEEGGGTVAERASLRRVLLALALDHPDIGYTQSMNFLAASCLIFCTEEETFHLVSYIVTVILPATFRPDLMGTFVDADILSSLLALECPTLAAHFAAVGIELPMITSKWFMTLFLLNFPTETALCVWDAIFANGPITIFQVALRVLKLAEPTLLSLSDPFAIIVRLSEETGRAYEGADVLIGSRAPPLRVSLDNGTIAILRKVGREKWSAKLAAGAARRAARAAKAQAEREERERVGDDVEEEEEAEEEEKSSYRPRTSSKGLPPLPGPPPPRPLPPTPPPPPNGASPAPLSVSDAMYNSVWSDEE